MVVLSREPLTKLLSALTAYLTVLHEIACSRRETLSAATACATVTKNAAIAKPTQVRKETRIAIYDAFETYRTLSVRHARPCAGIHVLISAAKTWMAGSSPAMTECASHRLHARH